MCSSIVRLRGNSVLSGFMELPSGAKRLILYYTLMSVPVVIEILFPIYLFMRGWELVSIGLLYSVASFSSVVGSYIVGRLFDEGIPPKYAMAIVDFTYGIIFFMFSIATDPYTVSLLMIALSFVDPLMSSYQTIEKDLYPSEMLEESFVYHMLLPNASQIIGFIGVGYFLTSIVSGVQGFILLFKFFSAVYFASSMFILIAIPETKPHKFAKLSVSSLPRELLLLAFAELLILFAYSLSSGFILLNFFYNVESMNVFLICLSLIPANVAGVIGSLLESKLGVNLRNISISLALIGASYFGLGLIDTVPLGILKLTLIATLIFASYLFHTIWFINHRTLFYRFTPSEVRGQIFGGLSSLRQLLNILSPIVASLIATQSVKLNFWITSILIILSIFPYYKTIKRTNIASSLSMSE